MSTLYHPNLAQCPRLLCFSSAQIDSAKHVRPHQGRVLFLSNAQEPYFLVKDDSVHSKTAWIPASAVHPEQAKLYDSDAALPAINWNTHYRFHLVIPKACVTSQEPDQGVRLSLIADWDLPPGYVNKFADFEASEDRLTAMLTPMVEYLHHDSSSARTRTGLITQNETVFFTRLLPTTHDQSFALSPVHFTVHRPMLGVFLGSRVRPKQSEQPTLIWRIKVNDKSVGVLPIQMYAQSPAKLDAHVLHVDSDHHITRLESSRYFCGS